MTPLATTDEVAAYSKGQVSADDPRLELALDGASAAVRRYCGWHIAPVASETLTLDGPGGRLLSLPSLNVTNMTVIVENDTVLGATDYKWSADGSVKKSGAYWTDEFRSVAVTLEHGYDYADIADVVSVVLAVVVRQLSSPTGATREQAGAVSVSWATTAPGVSGGIALLEHERAVLDRFRIVDA